MFWLRLLLFSILERLNGKSSCAVLKGFRYHYSDNGTNLNVIHYVCINDLMVEIGLILQLLHAVMTYGKFAEKSVCFGKIYYITQSIHILLVS